MKFLDDLIQFGMKPGLDRIRLLTSEVKPPRIIHVAGTNGKGSTCAFIESVLKEHGFNVGTYLSPHLVDVRERIRLNGRWAESDHLLAAVREMWDVITELFDMNDPPTYFEILTALALHVFALSDVDIAVLETGLGGRLDATNAFSKEVACITTIGMDHAHLLGPTIREIAKEKAGIIPPGIPAVTAVEGDALTEIRQHCTDVGSDLYEFGIHINISGSEFFDVETDAGTYRSLRCRMEGKFQRVNAALAIKCCEIMASPLRPEGVRIAIAKTFLPGRFQRVQWHDSDLILDCAHNADAAAALRESLGYAEICVFACMADKDVHGIMSNLPSRSFVLTTVNHDRSATRRQLEDAALELGLRYTWSPDPITAVKIASDLSTGPILVTGSCYLIGTILKEIYRYH